MTLDYKDWTSKYRKNLKLWNLLEVRDIQWF